MLILGWQRYAIYGAIFLSLAGVVWMHGYTRGEIKLFEYQAKQAKAAVPIIVKQGAVTEKVVTRWRTAKAKVEKEIITLTKEIHVYVPPSADPVLGLGWVQLHDAAATRSVPEAPDGVDVAAPAVAASQALKGVIENYGQCYGYAIQLMALQEWVRWQYETMNQEQLGY